MTKGKESVAASTQQALDRSKPFRDRIVRNTAVPCPYCDAPVGVRCISPTGSFVGGGHRDRRRLALQVARES